LGNDWGDDSLLRDDIAGKWWGCGAEDEELGKNVEAIQQVRCDQARWEVILTRW